MIQVPITIEGIEKLREELNKLKFEERPKLSRAIGEARAHGDLKENAEYHAAREMQSFVEGRINEIDSKLSNARVVDISKIENDGKVIFGSTAKLLNYDTEEEIVYKIVGEDEANIKDGKISFSSPIAKAVIGKYVDDDVEALTPNGKVEYKIISVEYV